MMTPTHLLTAAALLTRRGSRGRNIAVVAGALTPDLSIFLLFGWSKLIADIPSRVIWVQIYWQEPWQTLSAIFNSFPLYGALLLIAQFAGLRWLCVFAAAALVHLAFDFPFHNLDAHQHFWPLSDFRFHSPVSYWNRNHFGDAIRVLEIAIAAVCVAAIWRRFNALWVKAAMAVLLVSYIARPFLSYLWLK
jgi:hypothetical protein